MSYTEQDIQTALTRELTDERVAVAAAYWLGASPHERWVPDGIILARYVRYALAEIERLRNERRWISVKDRLPEQEGKYLTSFYDHDPEVALFENGKFHFWELNTFDTMEWCPTTYVSHWMLLPEPPKEVDGR